MNGWLWIDGTVVEAGSSAAVVPALDRGLLLGEGVYETCKVVDGTAFALTRHLGRLRRSALGSGLALPWTDLELREACAAVLEAAGRGRPREPDAVPGRLRITVTGGDGPLGPDRGEAAPRLLVAVGDQVPWPRTSAVATVPWTIDERGPLVGIKTTSRFDLSRCLDEAHARGADEAVLTNRAGVLAEGTASNLFLAVDGVLCTPSLATGCLAGITRELVLEAVASTSGLGGPTPDLARIEERDDLTLDDLRRASEVFLTSSTRGVHPVSSIDGRAVASAPGPLTAAASSSLAAVEAETVDP